MITPNITPQTGSDASETSPVKPKPSKSRVFLRFWPLLVVIIVIFLLAGLYLFTINQFNSQVTIDHAHHAQTTPNVHHIVHIRQKLLVGIDSTNSPFSFKPAGELVGFDVDLSKAIARELNVPVEFVEHDFDSSLSSETLGESNPLTDDRVDIVISGVTVNRMRQQYYSFSKPYLSAGLVAITPSGNTTIQQSSDLTDKLIGVVKHDPAIDFAKISTPEDRISIYASNEESVVALLNGSIDALLVEAPLAQSLVTNNSDIHIATDLLSNEDYAVMIMRGEDDLIEEIDNTLNLLRQKGVLESLRHKWLE